MSTFIYGERDGNHGYFNTEHISQVLIERDDAKREIRAIATLVDGAQVSVGEAQCWGHTDGCDEAWDAEMALRKELHAILDMDLDVAR